MPQISNQSVNIHYEVEGEGSPIMLVHGAFGSLEDLKEFGYAARLRGDYKVILIDLRGRKPLYTELSLKGE